MRDDDELLDEAAACKFIGGSKPIHPATLWRGVKAGRYSPPVHVGPNIVRWLRPELERDRERMIAERDGVVAA
jgi:predicted DNA-binding transcriptional regulator AlpA